MSRRELQARKVLEVCLFRGPVTRAPAATSVVLVPADERPLRGDAGRVDWRLCGQITDLLLSEFAGGDFAEATLFPVGPRLPSARVMLFGIGETIALGKHDVWRAMRTAVPKLLAIGASDVALAFPEAIDLDRFAPSVLSGLIEGISAEHRAVRLRVVIPEAHTYPTALRRATAEAARAASGAGILLQAEWLSPAEEVSVVSEARSG